MGWILTATARHFDFENPRPDQVHIADIAEALSNECRYSGQAGWYSVAQHSVHASHIVGANPELAFEALMHDAPEAYCKDISTPLKQLLPEYKVIERRVDLVIRLKYGLSPDESPEVKAADLVMLATERRDFLPHDETEWELLRGVTPLPQRLTRWPQREARQMFWARFWELVDATGRPWAEMAS